MEIKNKIREIVRLLILAFSLLFIITALYLFLKNYLNSYHNKASFNKENEIKREMTKKEKEIKKNYSYNQDFYILKNKNLLPDIIKKSNLNSYKILNSWSKIDKKYFIIKKNNKVWFYLQSHKNNKNYRKKYEWKNIKKMKIKWKKWHILSFYKNNKFNVIFLGWFNKNHYAITEFTTNINKVKKIGSDKKWNFIKIKNNKKKYITKNNRINKKVIKIKKIIKRKRKYKNKDF